METLDSMAREGDGRTVMISCELGLGLDWLLEAIWMVSSSKQKLVSSQAYKIRNWVLSSMCISEFEAISCHGPELTHTGCTPKNEETSPTSATQSVYAKAQVSKLSVMVSIGV